MSEEPDLVRLLYRADWTRLSLAAEVSASQDPSRDPGWLLGGVPPAPLPGMWPWSWPPGGSWTSPFFRWPEESVVWDEPPGEPGSSGESRESRESREESLWRRFGGSRRPPWAGHEWEMATEQQGPGPSRSTLLIAPGSRYRREGDDFMSGCDGTRSWHAVKENDTWSVVAARGPEPPPMASMLRPSWLLTGFSLETGGSLTVSGRDALRVTATPRPGRWDGPAASGRRGYRLRGPSDAKPPGGWFYLPDEIVVDAELGILLRWISLAGEQPVTRYELRDIAVAPPEPGDFRPDIPPGMRVVEETRDQPPSGPVNPWGLAARQAAKEARSALRNVLGALRGEDTR